MKCPAAVSAALALLVFSGAAFSGEETDRILEEKAECERMTKAALAAKPRDLAEVTAAAEYCSAAAARRAEYARQHGFEAQQDPDLKAGTSSRVRPDAGPAGASPRYGAVRPGISGAGSAPLAAGRKRPGSMTRAERPKSSIARSGARPGGSHPAGAAPAKPGKASTVKPGAAGPAAASGGFGFFKALGSSASSEDGAAASDGGDAAPSRPGRGPRFAKNAPDGRPMAAGPHAGPRAAGHADRHGSMKVADNGPHGAPHASPKPAAAKPAPAPKPAAAKPAPKPAPKK